MSKHVEELKNYPAELVAQLKLCIENQKALLKSDAVIIFTCGARFNPVKPTPRERLLEYSKKHLKQFQFFVAEDFFNIEGGQKVDLLTLEDNLGKYSDCIIIILDSESSFAELGAFANSEYLEKKLLVINHIQHRGSDSFLGLGPLARIDEKSSFKPVIYADLNSILVSIHEIQTRLMKIKRVYRKSVDLTSYDKFLNCDAKNRILFLLDLIQIFSPLTHKEIICLLKELFGDYSYDFINVEIGLLKAMKLIDYKEKYYFREGGHSRTFYNFEGLDFIKFRSKIVRLYHKTTKSRLEILSKRAFAENEEVSN